MKTNLKAVCLGVMVDIAGTIVAMFCINIIIGIVMASRGIDEKQAITILGQSFGYILLAFVVGMAFVALGGYTAARISKFHKVYNAFLVGVVSTLISIAGIINNPQAVPPWYIAAAVLLSIPFAYLGGVWGKNNRE